ncbi:DUF596 domain-containing protein [Stenotrophomonas lactitubi]|uniref:DUF596 domain-containing protein n=1 Tax=Stenotrophomonas lactitubi TaxID=2045214 RepID=UPI00224894F7|nr:DUF596 domain-containing protein [Stenotrophomonas lactitubi]MCX2896026.1 DUF596 domain-containing protein [Stenotrophomonas lactitubi]
MTEKYTNYVVEHSFGYSMVSMWQALNVALAGSSVDFVAQRDTFLDILFDILESGRARLASDGRFLEGSNLEQIQLLRGAWPSTREELESDLCLWFLIAAPAGVVWVLDNGELCWT